MLSAQTGGWELTGFLANEEKQLGFKDTYITFYQMGYWCASEVPLKGINKDFHMLCRNLLYTLFLTT